MPILSAFITGLMFRNVDARAVIISVVMGTTLYAIFTFWKGPPIHYIHQMLIVLILVAPQLRSVAHSQYPKLQIARSLLLMLATFFFFMALGRVGLAQATAVMSLNPVLITLGGALFLGEALGPRRIGAILVALVGALIVIAAALAGNAAAGTVEVYQLGDWAAPFGIILVGGSLSTLRVLLTAVLALCVLLYAIGSGWDDRGRHFHALFQFQLMGILGAFLTGDLFNLFAFF